jgi:hypothetical protein
MHPLRAADAFRPWRRRVVVACLFLSAAPARADRGNGVSAGLILSQDTSARAASLAGSVQALGDDVSAFGYNPAALATLSSHQAVVAYQKGLVNDSFSQIEYGMPLREAGLGASLSIYDGGSMDFVMGSTRKSVTSQRDVAAAVGYAHQFSALSLGSSVKFLSSELVETEKASTLALDFGATYGVNDRLRLGAAYQNLGANLKYGQEKSQISEVARAGAAFVLSPWRYRTTLLVDFPYLVNEQRFDAAVGADVAMGPVAVRAGYRTGVELGGLTLGAGFVLDKVSLDYAFGLIRDLESTHRISLSFRFGAAPPPVSPPAAGLSKGITIQHFPPSKKPPQAPVAAPVVLPKPAVPVPVFNGPGRGDCAEERSDSSVIFYGKGRSKCGQK